MRIEDVTKEDAIEIGELENELFKENAFGPMTVKAEIEAGYGFCFRDEGNIIAYALVRTSGGVTDLTKLAVVERFQRGGLGRRLLRAVIWTSSYPLILTVRKSNTRARALYASEGFEILSWFPSVGSFLMIRMASLRTSPRSAGTPLPAFP
jgi:ribosomal protein S18 acetylase RimI-like enzyme